MELTVAEAPRSTCHQALASEFVWETEPSENFPSVFPSTALEAPAMEPQPLSVLLCVAGFPCARSDPEILIVVESVVFAAPDPPPETPTEFTCGDVACGTTFTFTAMAG